MRLHPAPVALATVVLALTACSGASDTASTTSPSTSAGSAVASDPTATTVTTGTTAPADGTTAPASSPTTGRALADALRAAAHESYAVRTTVTGDQPMTVTGRGLLTDGTVAAHLEGSPDTAQDVEVVGGTAWTSLPGFTTGRQRVAVDLADESDQLAPTVASIVALADLERVVTATRSATSVRTQGSTVTAVVPGRSLVALMGTDLTGAVPASGPVTIELDAAGRPRTVSARVGTAVRTSTYSGWGEARPVTAPAAADVVESPL